MKNLITLAIIVLVGIFTVGCANTNTDTATTAVVESAEVPSMALVQEFDKIETSFNTYMADRHASTGWANEVRPGDVRDSRGIGDDLYKLQSMSKKLFELPTSDRGAGLQADIRAAMIEDCKKLLASARRNQELSALGEFLRYAQELDVEPESEFGAKPSDLRAEALVMAKKEVTELRPRVREGSGDAIGGIHYLLQEWAFTPKELGLTAEDLNALER